jgi:hypothetical protein
MLATGIHLQQRSNTEQKGITEGPKHINPNLAAVRISY